MVESRWLVFTRRPPRSRQVIQVEEEDRAAADHDAGDDRAEAHQQRPDVPVRPRGHQEADQRQLHREDRVQVQPAGDVPLYHSMMYNM